MSGFVRPTIQNPKILSLQTEKNRKSSHEAGDIGKPLNRLSKRLFNLSINSSLLSCCCLQTSRPFHKLLRLWPNKDSCQNWKLPPFVWSLVFFAHICFCIFWFNQIWGVQTADYGARMSEPWRGCDLPGGELQPDKLLLLLLLWIKAWCVPAADCPRREWTGLLV